MMSIGWKFKRLGVMSASELVFRIGRLIYQKLERRWIARGGAPRLMDAVRPGIQLFGRPKICVEHWQRQYKLQESALEDIVAGRLKFFGHEPMNFGQPINWHRDPSSCVELPLSYGKDIDYRDDKRVGNIKIVWELGRNQHLIPLAVAYVCTGETRYRETVTRQIAGWIQDNPFGMGVHWCSALEVALRLTAWSIIHSLLTLRDGDAGLFDAMPNVVEFRRSIFQQAWFIRRYLSRYSSANNHLIGELTGLFVATNIFDMGGQGRRWAEFARRELEREIVLQVHEDGVNKEQAVYYHLWVTEYLLLTWLVASRTGQPMSPQFRDRLRNMGSFLYAITPVNGVPPQIGDADDGSVVRFEAEWPCSPYDAVLSALELAFPGDSYRSKKGQIPEKAFWYGQISEGDTWSEDMTAAKANRKMPRIFPKGGYVVLGTPDRMVLFDGGALGYQAIAAHAHADTLSVCMAIDSRWWLIDPGTYAYHGLPEWRNYFRGTAAHNTVVVDDKDQSISGGSFLWTKHARAELTSVDTSSNGWQSVEGRHDGYKKLGIMHRREVHVSPRGNQVIINDALHGVGTRNFRVHFHFAPDIRVIPAKSDGEWLAEHEKTSVRLRIGVDTDWKWAVFRGSDSPRLGWYSNMLGTKEPAACLRGIIDTAAPCRHQTRIEVEAN